MPRILIIDDNDDMRRLMVGLLQNDHELHTSQDGQAGIEDAQTFKPDLIISDVSMPRITGYDVVKALRASPITARVPIILVTGTAHLQGMREGMNLGADDYLPKPFQPHEFLKAVADQLGKQEKHLRNADAEIQRLRSNISLMLPKGLLNPLTAIIAHADALSSEKKSLSESEVLRLAKDIEENGNQLHRLIKNFLIFTQAELITQDSVRRKALKEHACSSLAHCLEATAHATAKTRLRTSDLHIETQPGDVAITDQHLQKIISELLENAFAYSPPGTLVHVSTETGVKTARLRIHNASPTHSISESVEKIRSGEQLTRIFAESKLPGLGLPICIRLAELHDGSLTIDSTRGGTTTIVLELPLAAAALS